MIKSWGGLGKVNEMKFSRNNKKSRYFHSHGQFCSDPLLQSYLLNNNRPLHNNHAVLSQSRRKTKGYKVQNDPSG